MKFFKRKTKKCYLCQDSMKLMLTSFSAKSRNFYFSAKHTATYYWLILLTMTSNAPILRGCLCGNWKSIFLPLLIFDWRTFLRRVTAWWWRQSAKNEVSTNQNSRNRWCLIVRRTIYLKAGSRLRWPNNF